MLAKAELLDEFIVFFNNSIISEHVFDECVGIEEKKKTFDALLIEKRVNEDKIFVEKIRSSEALNELMKTFNLEQGESESLLLAIEKKAKLIGLDDGKAIKAAKILKINFITALTFVVLLHYSKKINSIKAKELVLKLEEIGRYRKDLIEKALMEVNR